MITRAPPRPPPPAGRPTGPPPTAKPPGSWRRIRALVIGPLIIALAAAAMYTAVRAAYGAFEHAYHVSAELPRAGQLLQVGSDVRLRGVPVGEVSEIEPAGRNVRLTLQIQDRYRIPQGAEAVISLKTLLGAKFVDLRVDGFEGPFLKDGSKIRRSAVGPELEDAVASGVRVFESINPDDLATVIHELATGARGHGEDVARGLEANSDLADLFANTLDPQLEALHDFRVVFGALDDRAVDLNDLADAINEGVPIYASPHAQQELDRALEAVVPFADNLADLLILNRADWDRMFDAGDQVLATIAGRPEDLRDLVTGLYVYMLKLGGQPPFLSNRTAEAPFANFMGGTDAQETRQQICDGLPVEIREEAPLCSGDGEGPPRP